MHEWHLESEFRFENCCEYSLVGLFPEIKKKLKKYRLGNEIQGKKRRKRGKEKKVRKERGKEKKESKKKVEIGEETLKFGGVP